MLFFTILIHRLTILWQIIFVLLIEIIQVYCLDGLLEYIITLFAHLSFLDILSNHINWVYLFNNLRLLLLLVHTFLHSIVLFLNLSIFFWMVDLIPIALSSFTIDCLTLVNLPYKYLLLDPHTLWRGLNLIRWLFLSYLVLRGLLFYLIGLIWLYLFLERRIIRSFPDWRILLWRLWPRLINKHF